MARVGALWRRLTRANRGNVAVIVALAVPALCMLVVGAVEIGFVVGDRSKLQDATDAAALATAQELALAVESGAEERAMAMALAQVAGIAARSDVTADAEIVEDGAGIRVRLTSHRDSFFGNILPPGGFTTHAESVAVGMGRTPLCVLAHGDGKGETIKARDTALLSAPGCLIHSNDDIKVDGSASLRAGAVQSVRAATGNISPKPGVGAEAIEDPFSLRDLSGSGSCKDLIDFVITKVTVLPAGRHCKKIEVVKGGSLTLAPGEHFFERSELKMSEDSVLIGDDVVLIFDKDSKFTFQDSSTVDLRGRRSGKFAGFLIVTTRRNVNDFVMMSDNVRTLLGVIYIPAAKLIVQGRDQIAERSPWTVIVAQRLELKGSPTLVINRNYAVGGVPVPDGVGNQRSDVRLQR